MNEEHRESGVTIEEAQTVKVGTSRPSLSTPAAIIIGSALISAAVYFGLTGGGLPNVPSSAREVASPPSGGDRSDAPVGGARVDVDAGTLPVLGDPDAPVLVVEWADFQCPFCGRLHSQVFPQLREQYIDSGKVRFAYRDFAFLGQESVDAAIAARCANEQGKFWAYHDKIFENQSGENQGAFSKANLKQFARELGLDTAQFNACLDSDKYEDAVREDTDAGRDAGVSGTPTTFINGRMVNGAQPFSAFQRVIEEELGG